MLTDISNRLTPSVPLEITFSAQPIATKKKVTTIFGHMAVSPGIGMPYQVYNVVNVGDSTAAGAEVSALAGVGSQAQMMVVAFINANSGAGRSNFPAVRVVLIPNSEIHFGPASEAIKAVSNVRSDMFVSCYPASDSANRATLLALVSTVSGIDRDLSGQFGSFATFGSIDVLSAAQVYNINSRGAIVAYLQDTNTALVASNGVLTAGSNVVTALTITAGVYPGAQISGTGVPAGAVVGVLTVTTATMVDALGNPLLASVNESAEVISFQNVVSQAAEIVAAGHAGVMMGSAFPYNPLQGVTAGALMPPKKASDIIAIDPNGASEAALAAGLSPLYLQPGGTMGLVRTRTTYALLPDGVTAATSYIDWQDLVVINDFKESIYQVSQNPPFNNNPGGSKASLQIASKFKDEVLRVAQIFEDGGAFQGVKTLAPLFVVQPSLSSRGRFDFFIPINVLPGLYVIAGNIQAQSTLGNFTL